MAIKTGTHRTIKYMTFKYNDRCKNRIFFFFIFISTLPHNHNNTNAAFFKYKLDGGHEVKQGIQNLSSKNDFPTMKTLKRYFSLFPFPHIKIL